MRVSVELPDPPPIDQILEGLSHQYGQVLQRLLHLTEQAQRTDHLQPVVAAMQQQQDQLMAAFERMVQVMSDGKQADRQQLQHVIRQEVAAPQQEASQALLQAIRGMKRSVSALPEELGSAMTKQMKTRQDAVMKAPPAPKAPDTSRAVVKKLGEMESALVSAMGKSRSRTFGSNY